MGLLESLIIGIGTSIAKVALKVWLKDHEIVAEAGGSISSILIKKIPDLLEQNAAVREFEKIRDHSAESILKLLKKEGSSISEARLTLITNGASTTLEHIRIDTDLVVTHHLDKEALLEHLLRRTGAEGGNPALAGTGPENRLFSDEEQLIYRRILSHAAQLIVDMASTFPSFQERAFCELFRQVGALAQQVIDGMNIIVAEQSDAFEADYRSACVRKFDQLELFGVDVQENNRRYNLSIAYVTLMIQQAASPQQADTEYVSGATSEEDMERNAIPADIALATTERLFVRGPAGSGKTTLLQWFVVFSAARKLEGDLAAFNDFVPFLLKLRHFSDTALPGPELFPAQASIALGGKVPQNWVHDRLESGRAIVLIDGLDEISETRRPEVREWLRDLTGTYPKARYIITSRPHAAEEGWLDADSFVDTELQDMDRNDINEFINHWHDAVADGIRDDEEKRLLPELANTLKNKLGRSSAILRLATSPLLCALLCALHRQRVTNLPTDRIELYRACIDMFFRRDVEKKVDSTDYLQLSDRQKESLLQDFAWWMIRNGKTTSTPEEAQNRFDYGFNLLRGDKPSNGNGVAVLKLFLQRIGIIRQLAASKIDFPHRTFQEYLASRAAVDQGDLGILVAHAHDPQWREVVVLSAGHFSALHAENLIRSLLERASREPNLRHALTLVASAALDVVVSSPEASSNLEWLVAEHISTIVPPRSLSEATELAAAGDLVVPYLYARGNYLRVKESVNSIRTLALIGSEAAFDGFCSWSRDSRVGVWKELLISVSRFRDDLVNKFLLECRFPDRVNEASFCGHRVHYVHPLASCSKLYSLDLSGTRVSDIKPLVGCRQLTKLNLSGSEVEDLAPIGELRKLRELYLNGLNISDISRLKSCTMLELLSLHRTHVSDISSLHDCTAIKFLNLGFTKVSDISALRGLKSLFMLDLNRVEVNDIRSLVGCVNLERIDLSGTFVHDLSSLRGFERLVDLSIFGTPVSDISVLSDIPNLRTLNIGGTAVEDISVLGACKNLERIFLHNSRVTDFSPLKNCPMLNEVYVDKEVTVPESLANKFRLFHRALSGNLFVQGTFYSRQYSY